MIGTSGNLELYFISGPTIVHLAYDKRSLSWSKLVSDFLPPVLGTVPDSIEEIATCEYSPQSNHVTALFHKIFLGGKE